jgi:hypothetical protein
MKTLRNQQLTDSYADRVPLLPLDSPSLAVGLAVDNPHYIRCRRFNTADQMQWMSTEVADIDSPRKYHPYPSVSIFSPAPSVGWVAVDRGTSRSCAATVKLRQPSVLSTQ